MISTLVFRHPAVRKFPQFVLHSVIGSALFLNVLGVLVYKSGEDSWSVGPLECLLLGLTVLWGFVGFLIKGNGFCRCRDWEAGLPIPARSVWLSYYFALLLVSMLVAAGLFGALGGLLTLASHLSKFEIVSWSTMALVYSRPVALIVMMIGAMAVWQPVVVNPGDHPGWGKFRRNLILAAVALLVLSVFLPPWVLLVGVVLSIVQVIRVLATIPPQLEIAATASETIESSNVGDLSGHLNPARSNRFILHKFLVLSLFKSPYSLIFMLLFVLLFGVMGAGYYPMEPGESDLRFFNFTLVVYILFASTGHFVWQLGKVDSLPISRNFILSWLVLPMVLALSAGYGVGRILVATTLTPENPIAYYAPDCEDCSTVGLSVNPEFFAVSYTEETPTIVAPWGETSLARSEPLLAGLPLKFWKPYTTKANSSPEFVAWQICRAVEKVYGVELNQEEILTSFLTTTADGAVVLQRELDQLPGLEHAKIRNGGPVFALYTGLQIAVLLLIQGLVFRWVRGLTTKKAIQRRFFSTMGFLIILHIGGIFLLTDSFSENWIVTGAILGQIRLLGDLGLAGHVLGWLAAAGFVAAAWRFALSGFASLDALPFTSED